MFAVPAVEKALFAKTLGPNHRQLRTRISSRPFSRSNWLVPYFAFWGSSYFEVYWIGPLAETSLEQVEAAAEEARHLKVFCKAFSGKQRGRLSSLQCCSADSNEAGFYVQSDAQGPASSVHHAQVTII